MSRSIFDIVNDYISSKFNFSPGSFFKLYNLLSVKSVFISNFQSPLLIAKFGEWKFLFFGFIEPSIFQLSPGLIEPPGLLEYSHITGDLLIIGEPSETDKITKKLKDKYSDLVEINKTFDNLCEVSSLQGNKLNSTKVLLDLLNLKDSDLFYFGDGEADLELLNYAKYGYTVKDSIANDKLPYLNTIEAPEKSGFFNFINSITY